MQIRSVRHKTVRDAAELMDDPCCGSRVTRKMSMNVIDLQLPHASSQRHARRKDDQRTDEESPAADIGSHDCPKSS